MKSRSKWLKWVFLTVAMILVMALALPGCAPEEVAPPEEEVKPPPEEEVKPPPEEEEEVAPTYPTMKLTASSFLPPYPALESETIHWFCEEVTERSDGAITFDIYYGASLIGAREHVDGIGTGVADVGLVAWLYTPTKWELHRFQYEFLFRPNHPVTVVKASRQLFSEFPQFREEEYKNNVHWLAVDTWDDYSILSSVPIRTLDDMKGLTIGVYGGLLEKLVTAAGGAPITSPAGERYLQLQNKVIDASMLSINSFADTAQWEVGDYVVNCFTGANDPIGFVINLDRWNSFSPEVQELFTEVAEEVEERHAQSMFDARGEKAQMLMDHGVQIFDMPQAELTKWGEACPDITATWVADVEELGYPGTEIARRYIEICEEMGHTWAVKSAVQE